MMPDPSLVDRFRTDLAPLLAEGAGLGVAVSGGPDSLALLFLAAAAIPGRLEAATVDHGLRAGSRDEAERVAELCRQQDVPHRILTAQWKEIPAANLQARARAERYRLLGAWADEQGFCAVATAHHLDDQAETFLLRAARGSGLAGLSAMRRSRPLTGGVLLIRPVLGWQRSELRSVVDGLGLDPAADPSNEDDRFDRVRARRWLAQSDGPESERLAAAADHLADSADALEWAAEQEFARRGRRTADGIDLDSAGLPVELQRRLLARALADLTGQVPPGPKLMQALQAMERGETVTLAGVRLAGGSPWQLRPAPPHRR